MIYKVLCVFVIGVTMVDSSIGWNNFSIQNLGETIKAKIEKTLKPMRVAQAKNSMKNGMGGVTFVMISGKIIMKKEGVSYECLGAAISEKPYCSGTIVPLQIQTVRDLCFSDRYFQLGNRVCLGFPDQHGIAMLGANGRYSCYASDARKPLLITLTQYRNLCGRLPWEGRKIYIPDPSSPQHVNLPNPDLGCTVPSDLVCEFNDQPNSHFM